MSKRTMDDLKAMLCKELDEIAMKGKIGAGELQTVHMLTDTIKNIDKIGMLDDGYSGDGEWNARGNYSRNGSMMNNDGGYSGRMHYVRGHYSRDDGMDMISERIGEMIDSGRYSGEERNTLNRAMRIISDR